jgi:hypothetical protein
MLSISPIDHSPDFVKIVIQSWWPVDMNVQEDFAVKGMWMGWDMGKTL